VTIRLPDYAGFKPSSLHDIEIRIGNESQPPSSKNQLCRKEPQLKGTPGSVVTVNCSKARLRGSVVTIQIK